LKTRSRENPVRKRSIFKGFSYSHYPQHTAIYWVLSLRDSGLYREVARLWRFRNLKSKPGLRPTANHDHHQPKTANNIESFGLLREGMEPIWEVARTSPNWLLRGFAQTLCTNLNRNIFKGYSATPKVCARF
jgi:hypothetical protein